MAIKIGWGSPHLMSQCMVPVPALLLLIQLPVIVDQPVGFLPPVLAELAGVPVLWFWSGPAVAVAHI